MVGHKVSHSNIKTKKRQKPNLQCVKVIVNGTTRRMRVCTRCIRSGRVVKAP
jgi:large subunit ribosomal protein L28